MFGITNTTHKDLYNIQKLHKNIILFLFPFFQDTPSSLRTSQE